MMFKAFVVLALVWIAAILLGLYPLVCVAVGGAIGVAALYVLWDEHHKTRAQCDQLWHRVDLLTDHINNGTDDDGEGE